MAEKQRRTPQQSRSRATVDAILEAAAQILEARGPGGFTAKRVAEVAGVSIGSLYQYFADKHAILEALRERHDTANRESLVGATHPEPTLSLRDAVRTGVESVIAARRSAPRLHATLACEPTPIAPEDLRTFRESTRHYLETHRDVTREIDPALASVVVTRAALALIHTTSVEEPEWLDHPAFASEVSELIIRCLEP